MDELQSQGAGDGRDENPTFDHQIFSSGYTPSDASDISSQMIKLAISLREQFDRTGAASDINSAVYFADIAVQARPSGHPGRPGNLTTLANCLGRRFELLKDMDDVNRAIDVATEAVEATPPENRNLALRLNNLVSWLSIRFDQTQSMDDLNHAIEFGSRALEADTCNQALRIAILKTLKQNVGARFKRTQEIGDLDGAVNLADLLVKATNQQHDRNEQLDDFLDLLDMRFERTGLVEDINFALDTVELALEATPQNHLDYSNWLNRLGIWLGRRFGRIGDMNDINRAIDVSDSAVNATPPDHPDLANRLSNLGTLFGLRFEQTEKTEDITRGVEVSERAVKAVPTGHPNRAGILSGLANRLGMRFKRFRDEADIDGAIEIANKAVEATPSDHFLLPSLLNNLGVWYGNRFEWKGSTSDLNSAIEVIGKSVEATPPDSPDLAGHLNNLGNWLKIRYQRTGELADINRSVEVTKKAVQVIPHNHASRSGLLNSFGTALGVRSQRNGSMDDLNHAIETIQEAVVTTPSDQPNKARWLFNLGSWLCRRFEQVSELRDINKSIEAMEEAMNSTSSDPVNQFKMMDGLGYSLSRRFERTQQLKDINCAIYLANEVLELMPLDHPSRADSLNNLGNHLGMRFKQTRDMDDIDHALDAAKKALAATPSDHPRHIHRLNNIGVWYDVRFKTTQAMDDVNAAIDYTRKAVNAINPNLPERAGMLNNLGNQLDQRYKYTRSRDDIDEALLCFREGLNCPGSPASIRVRVAARAAAILAWDSDWQESYKYWHKAVELLQALSPRFLQHTDKQHMLGEFTGLASRAAAIALNAGNDAQHALNVLELGRGVITGLLLDMRTDISSLREKCADLAEEFISLRDDLDSPPDPKVPLSMTGDFGISGELQARRRREADEKFKNVLDRIRALEGFDRFLLPPTADELMAEAQSGPIIIVNVSPYRCDAFLIEQHQIRVLELPDLDMDDVEERAQGIRLASVSDIAQMLVWLWTVVASPVLEALGYNAPPSDDDWPHVWWILTGPLCHFPIHAAGHHMKGSTETVLDRVMSSYSSSIKALIHGRRRMLTAPAAENALLVAMEETPGLSISSILGFAEEEVEMVDSLCPSLKLKPVRPELCKEAILGHLRACNIFHFAGHGLIDPLEPSRSCLLLKDWKTNPLTVADLRDQNLHESPPFLGYLSACSTGVTETAKLVDEAIHLVSACQLAGFRHVIGTLWEVFDSRCVSVARVLYQTIRDEGMTDRAICWGLHKAVRALREKDLKPIQAKKGTSGAGKSDADIILVVGDSTIEIVKKGEFQFKLAREDRVQNIGEVGSVPATFPRLKIRPAYAEEEQAENCGNESEDLNECENTNEGKDKNDGQSTTAMSGGGDDTTREERNVVVSGQKSHKARSETTLSWVPYIHFGI